MKLQIFHLTKETENFEQNNESIPTNVLSSPQDV